MLYKNFDLHNVADVEESPLGLKLYRFPKPLCDSMGLGTRLYGRHVARSTPGCEIRFVTGGERALISLSAIGEDGFVEVFRGDFRYFNGACNNYCYPVRKGQVTQIELVKDSHFESMPSALKRKEGSFSPDVWRIMGDVNFYLTFVDFDDMGFGVRPPRPDEMPEKTMLCYGTSLTFGACGSTHSTAYCQLMGRLLNVNLLNKSMGGSCMNEPQLADYFASDAVQYDALFLENAVNMDFDPAEYEKRTRYLLEQVTQKKPDVPIFMVTSYPSYATSEPISACPVTKKLTGGCIENDAAIRRMGEEFANVHVIEGSEMLTDFTALTCDMIHLSDYGHIMVGTNLARRINELWKR